MFPAASHHWRARAPQRKELKRLSRELGRLEKEITSLEKRTDGGKSRTYLYYGLQTAYQKRETLIAELAEVKKAFGQ